MRSADAGIAAARAAMVQRARQIGTLRILSAEELAAVSEAARRHRCRGGGGS